MIEKTVELWIARVIQRFDSDQECDSSILWLLCLWGEPALSRDDL